MRYPIFEAGPGNWTGLLLARNQPRTYANISGLKEPK